MLSRHHSPGLRLAAPLCAITLLAAACGGQPGGDPGESQAWRSEVKTFRAERAERLTQPDGWLTLVGLEWLEPGEQTFGVSPRADVKLPLEEGPDVAGTLKVDPPEVHLEPRPGAGLVVDGEPAEAMRLVADTRGEPTIVSLGRLRFYVIEREGRFGLRIKDPKSPTRLDFPGLSWYPIDPDWRLTGRFERYDRPRRIELAAAAGPAQEAFVPGLVRFEAAGQELSLAPVVSDPEARDARLFFVFHDRTSGSTTYPAGRFLYAEPPESGEVVLDFNKAYSPPCAFTPFATCPLPPPENRLPVAVEAGEKDPGLH